MSLQLIRSLLLCCCLLFIALPGLSISIGPPVPLTDPLSGGAWTRSDSASSVWVGDHFLAVWIERRDPAADGDWLLMAGRIGAGGERIDAHGIELERLPKIEWARVVVAAGEPHAVYQLPGEIVVSRIGSSFGLTPIASFQVLAESVDVASSGDHIFVSWADRWSGPVHAVVADVAAGTTSGPIHVADEGFEVAAAGDGERFLVVYNQNWSGPPRVRATFVSLSGTVEDTILVDDETHRSRPAAAFAGEDYLIAYGHPVRLRSLSPTGELGEIHSSSYREAGQDQVLTAGSAIGCGGDECLVVAEIYPICHLSACPVPISLVARRVDPDGNPLDEEWERVTDGSFASPRSHIASSDEHFLLTWSGRSRVRGLVVDASPLDEQPPASFALSTGATSQRDPIGTDWQNQSFVVWNESGDDADESCLRAALIGRNGRRIAEESVSECTTGIKASWAASGDGLSWLAVWSEYDEELGKAVGKGRIMRSPDLSGESFVIAEQWMNGLVAAGGSAGHVVVWRGYDALYATRVSSTGQVLGDPWPVVWGTVYEPLLVRLGSGYALLWDGGYCPGEVCGLRYRFLTATGETEGNPVAIAPRGFQFDAVETSDGGAFLVWREDLPEIRAAFIRQDGTVVDRGVIGSSGSWGAVHAGRDGEGFVVAVEIVDGSSAYVETSLLIRLDRSGTVTGEPAVVEGRIQETIGDGLLLEQRHVIAPPFFGTPRLFLRSLDHQPVRRRLVRPR